MQILQNSKVNSLYNDQRVWRGDPHGEFSVSFFFKLLNRNATTQCLADFLRKSPVPSKVAFFMWVFFHGKPPTQDLQSRGLMIINQCYLCYQEEKTCDHLFLHCRFAFEIWGRCLSKFWKWWVQPTLVQALIWEWIKASRDGLSQYGREIWIWLPFAVC